MKHGEGKKWYLEASNYSEDLLSDVRRRKFLVNFFSETDKLEGALNDFEKLDKAPWLVKRLVRWKLDRFFRKNHHGQVLPIEDVEKIFGFTNSIVRFSCICRTVMKSQEKRYCYGVSMGPQGGKFAALIDEVVPGFLDGPDSKGMEILGKEEAVAAFKEHEHEGLCHSIWTFGTPFIGGICNCDRPDCIAMKTTVTYGIPSMYRAEHVAQLNPALCTGCRQCMRVCQFGALSYSVGNKKVAVDSRHCYGCGICRAVCEKNAIHLDDRSNVPAVANLW
jgi:Pyruvate/2-oxoacid:ferredoxin oxidoreductase delta subunit